MPHMNNDPWVWRVEDADGSTLDEYDADAPDGHGWADALALASETQTRITRVLLIPQRDALHTHVVTLTSDTASVRIFRRRSVTVSGETGEQTIGPSSDPITVIALGEGCYTFLFADGSLVVSDDLNAV